MAFTNVAIRPTVRAGCARQVVSMCSPGAESGTPQTTRRDVLRAAAMAGIAAASLSLPQVTFAEDYPPQVKEVRDYYLPRVERLGSTLTNARDLVKNGKIREAEKLLEDEHVFWAITGMDKLAGTYSKGTEETERTAQLKEINGIMSDNITLARQASAARKQGEAETALTTAIKKYGEFCAGVDAKPTKTSA